MKAATEGLAASLRHKYKILFFANLKTDLKSATGYLFYFHFLLGKAIDEIDELVGISLSLSLSLSIVLIVIENNRSHWSYTYFGSHIPIKTFITIVYQRIEKTLAKKSSIRKIIDIFRYEPHGYIERRLGI